MDKLFRSPQHVSSDEVRGPLGLCLLYQPSESLIDFIFVHGLRGGSRKTWSKTPDPASFWPKEWLPKEPKFKNVRIHSFGYQSDWGDRKSSSLTLHDFGQALLADVQNTLCSATDADRTPLVLVGHSMGGLVLKKMLLLARQDPLYHHVAARIHSMFFLATPHRGADSAQLLSNMLKIAVGHGAKAYVDGLIPSSDTNQIINDSFRHAYQGIEIWSFFETVATSFGVIVPRDSAVLDLPGEHVALLNADHRNVCKFDDPSDSNYISLRKAFISTINSIELKCYSAKKASNLQDMGLLTKYLGITRTPDNDLANVTEHQLEGSCEWLTDLPVFLNWRSGLQNQPKMFWLTGDPAIGKSILAGHVAKHLQDLNADCASFFFKHHKKGNATIADLFCSMAWQMASLNTDVRRSLLAMVQDDVPLDRADERDIWRSVFSSRIFRIQFRQPLFWVIDGIDEASNWASFFPLLAKIDAQFPLQVFITSRPALAIERSLSQERIPHIQQCVSRERSLSDIALYVRRRAQFLPCESESQREELVQRLLEKSNGNFLWTSLVVRQLEDAMSEERTIEILESVPEQLQELYASIFKNLMISPKETALVSSIFSWVICSSRPLFVEELKSALQLDIGENLSQLEKTVRSISGNLVYVDSQARVWPAHQTVKEYLHSDKPPTQLTIKRKEAHFRISKVALKYLSGDELKVPRHRRGTAVQRQRTRSPFCEYAIKHFSDHLVRSASSAESLLVDLDVFLKTNSLVWLELIAATGDLGTLVDTARNIKMYLERRSKYEAPIGEHTKRIRQWSIDLVHLVARFGKAMTTSPSYIAHLIPPLCPKSSSINQAFFDFYPRGLKFCGLQQEQWNDRLSCMEFPGVQVYSMASRDNHFAIGLSSGYVNIYHESSFQQHQRLNHDEAVRHVAFSNHGLYVASVGWKKISVWSSSTGVRIWTAARDEWPLAMDFNEDDTVLMVSTKANTLHFWTAEDGNEIEVSQFFDVNEDDQSPFQYDRPPIRARFCPGLNALGVAYSLRPISFWDLETHEFLGQYHKAGAVYPEPLIYDFIFNPNPDICLAAVAYQGSHIAVFDPFTQITVAEGEAITSTLAASADGAILASGSGDGIIRLFDFETLRLLYQINSDQQNISRMIFNSGCNRVLEVRSDQVNIWEPSALAYHSTKRDDSSMNLTESVQESPEYGGSSRPNEDLIITSVAAHSDPKFIFCGRENGTISIYSCETGQEIQALITCYVGLAVVKLIWIEKQAILMALDRPGGFSMQSIVMEGKNVFSPRLLLQQSRGLFKDALMKADGKFVLLVGTSSVELLRVDGTVVCHLESSDGKSLVNACQHPKDAGRFIIFDGQTMRFHDWETGAMTESKTMGEMVNCSAPLFVTSSARYLALLRAGSWTSGETPSLQLLSLSDVQTGQEPKIEGSFDDIAKNIKAAVGTFRSQLVYLDIQGWICSINVDDTTSQPKKFYTRHFFVPLHWHSGTQSISIAVTSKGTVVLAVEHEIAIFQNGLVFEDRIGWTGTVVSSRASMRSIMKRGVSEPDREKHTSRPV